MSGSFFETLCIYRTSWYVASLLIRDTQRDRQIEVHVEIQAEVNRGHGRHTSSVASVRTERAARKQQHTTDIRRQTDRQTDRRTDARGCWLG